MIEIEFEGPDGPAAEAGAGPWWSRWAPVLVAALVGGLLGAGTVHLWREYDRDRERAASVTLSAWVDTIDERGATVATQNLGPHPVQVLSLRIEAPGTRPGPDTPLDLSLAPLATDERRLVLGAPDCAVDLSPATLRGAAVVARVRPRAGGPREVRLPLDAGDIEMLTGSMADLCRPPSRNLSGEPELRFEPGVVDGSKIVGELVVPGSDRSRTLTGVEALGEDGLRLRTVQALPITLAAGSDVVPVELTVEFCPAPDQAANGIGLSYEVAVNIGTPGEFSIWPGYELTPTQLGTVLELLAIRCGPTGPAGSVGWG